MLHFHPNLVGRRRHDGTKIWLLFSSYVICDPLSPLVHPNSRQPVEMKRKKQTGLHLGLFKLPVGILGSRQAWFRSAQTVKLTLTERQKDHALPALVQLSFLQSVNDFLTIKKMYKRWDMKDAQEASPIKKPPAKPQERKAFSRMTA